MLGWFADAPDPDAGLLAFRQVSDALGHDALVPAAAARRGRGRRAARPAARARSRYAADLLLRAPEAVALLGRRRRAACRATAPRCDAEVAAAVGRHDDPAGRGRRGPRRCAAASCSGSRPPTCSACSTVDAGRGGAHRRRRRDRAGGARRRRPRSVASDARRRRCRPGSRSSRWAGFGGHELGYGSDADVLFVHDPLPRRRRAGRDRRGARGRQRAAPAARACPAPDPPLVVDADLRPEGRQGPLVRTLASYARLLRALVAGLGEPGAAAGRAGRRRRRPRPRGSSR